MKRIHLTKKFMNKSNSFTARTIPALLLVLFLGFGTLSAGPEAGDGIHTGKLVQMFKSGGYTYLEYESGGKKYWAASKTVVANVGDIIEFHQPLVMKNFYSKSLKKTFDLIYFAGLVRSAGTPGKLSTGAMNQMTGHGKMMQKGKEIEVKPGSVQKAEGGLTIAECFGKRTELKGKEVVIRGVVTKFSAKIKGKNWVHIRDGSGKDGKNDITFTTLETLAPGETVTLRGILILDKDIGSGYRFPLFLEDPEVIREE